MGVKEKAAALHEQGFNCAQSVLGALGEYTGLEPNAALSVASGFGGGVRCGEICGAVSGGVMALGMTCSKGNPADPAVSKKIRELTAAYTKTFRERFGCIRCADLKNDGKICPLLIEYAVLLAEETLQNNE